MTALYFNQSVLGADHLITRRGGGVRGFFK